MSIISSQCVERILIVKSFSDVACVQAWWVEIPVSCGMGKRIRDPPSPAVARCVPRGENLIALTERSWRDKARWWEIGGEIELEIILGVLIVSSLDDVVFRDIFQRLISGVLPAVAKISCRLVGLGSTTPLSEESLVQDVGRMEME